MTSIAVLLERPRRGVGAVLPRADALAADLGVPATVMAWIATLLLLDRHASLAAQGLLGAATWLLLLALTRREATPVRVQVAVVVLFATAVEYTFSGWLGVYTYHLGTVPSFVPPGHGLVYLCALALGRSRLFAAHRQTLVTLTVVGGGGYAAWGLLLSPRHDVLGAFWFLCLLGFLRWGRSALLFVGAFVVVTYLELLGTAVGTWAWQPLDPSGHIPIGNPPSGAAGGYGWFDLAAVLATPVLLRGIPVVRRAAASLRPARAPHAH
ncbi:MAG: hypothetical protein ACTHJ6_07640 [Oryzihumus sp.]